MLNKLPDAGFLLKAAVGFELAIGARPYAIGVQVGCYCSRHTNTEAGAERAGK
jgi:hypothetical protein